MKYVLADGDAFDPWTYLSLGNNGPFSGSTMSASVKNFFSSINMSLTSIGVTIGIVSAVLYMVMMIIKRNPQARAEYKSKYLHMFVLIWLLCSVTSIVGLIYSVIVGFV